MRETASRDAMADDAKEVATALIHTFGLIAGHLYAYARAHPYLHFGGEPDAYRRLFWRKVVFRIERTAAHQQDTPERGARLHSLNVRA